MSNDTNTIFNLCRDVVEIGLDSKLYGFPLIDLKNDKAFKVLKPITESLPLCSSTFCSKVLLQWCNSSLIIILPENFLSVSAYLHVDGTIFELDTMKDGNKAIVIKGIDYNIYPNVTLYLKDSNNNCIYLSISVPTSSPSGVEDVGFSPRVLHYIKGTSIQPVFLPRNNLKVKSTLLCINVKQTTLTFNGYEFMSEGNRVLWRCKNNLEWKVLGGES